MERGLILALIGALCFAVSAIYLRRAVYQTGESFTGVAISVFTGVPFFTVSLFFSGGWDKLWSVSGQAFILLGAAGIMHFVLGRQLSYSCFRLVGANRGGAILRTQMFYAAIFGIAFLKEPLTIILVLGILCIAAGATLVSVKKVNETTEIHGRGVLAGLGGAFFWGTSGVLIRPAVVEIGSPYAGAFISYVVAAVIIAGLLFGKGQREQLFQLRRKSLIHLVISGVFVSVAQLFRYVALSYSPVSLVVPIMGTDVLFIFFLSFLINRNIEVFTWKVFIGIMVAVVGTFLLLQ